MKPCLAQVLHPLPVKHVLKVLLCIPFPTIPELLRTLKMSLLGHKQLEKHLVLIVLMIKNNSFTWNRLLQNENCNNLLTLMSFRKTILYDFFYSTKEDLWSVQALFKDQEITSILLKRISWSFSYKQVWNDMRV